MTGPCPGRVVVTLSPQIGSTQWEAGPEKGQELDLSVESPCELREPEPSPFSSRRTMYETEEVRPGGHVVAVGRGKGLPGAPGDVAQQQRNFHLFHHLIQRGVESNPAHGAQERGRWRGPALGADQGPAPSVTSWH